MAEIEKTVRPPAQWIKSSKGVAEVYGNLAHIMWSLDDVRVRIAQLIESPTTPNPGPGFVAVAEERAAVTMTWRSAKLMRDNLSKVIDAYEKANGEIAIGVTLPDSQ